MRRAAVGHPADRADELGDVADPVLEQVADALGRVGEQLHRQAELDVLREHEHADRPGAARGSRAPRAAPRRCAWAAGGCRRSTTSSGVAAHLAASARRRPALGDDVEARLGEQPGEPLAQQDAVLGDRYPHGISARTRVPPPRGRPHAQPAAERLDPVGEAAQAGARSVSAPPTPSSPTSTTSSPFPRAITRRSPTLAWACLPTLARLSRDDVVGGDLDRLVEPVVDARRRASPGPAERRRERLERDAEPVGAEHRRVQAAGDRRAAPRARPRSRCRASSSRACASGSSSSRFSRHLELERERDQPLLGAVVEVALEPLALLLAGLDHAPARALRAPRAARCSSACSRPFSSAIPAAAPTARSSSGSSSSAGSWTSAASARRRGRSGSSARPSSAPAARPAARRVGPGRRTAASQ